MSDIKNGFLIIEDSEHASPAFRSTSAQSSLKEAQSCDPGACVVKPMKFDDLLEVVRRMHGFWQSVGIPEKRRGS